MGKCRLCSVKSLTISDVIGVCSNCLRDKPEEALKYARRNHWRYDYLSNLKVKEGLGIKCGLCVNECVIPPGGRGRCGVWVNAGGKLEPVAGWGNAVVHWYLDPLPTNCVATPICPAATYRGYPKYSVSKGAEYGYYNLAVFFAGCDLDCLFCQNWEHRRMIEEVRVSDVRSVEELVRVALDNDRITCVCYFGGDPGPHIPYALEASRRIINNSNGKVKRICWETNGIESPSIMKEMGRLSLVSGGIVKVDWKAWTPSIYEALTGVNGEKALKRLKTNCELLFKLGSSRMEIPLLVVSTLLVPGYVDPYEVGKIAEFLASLSNEIPYILLAFHPDYLMRDLPPTSIRHAEEAYEQARAAGLKYVYIGNEWLLGNYY